MNNLEKIKCGRCDVFLTPVYTSLMTSLKQEITIFWGCVECGTFYTEKWKELLYVK